MRSAEFGSFQLTIVGVTGPHGEPVVIESSAAVIANTCELLSSNIVLRNLTLRSLVEDVPPNHWYVPALM